MAPAHDIQVVAHRRVILLVRRLDAALGHHRVGVAVTQLGDHQHLGARLARHEGCRRPGAAGTDDQDVSVIVDVRQVQAGTP